MVLDQLSILAVEREQSLFVLILEGVELPELPEELHEHGGFFRLVRLALLRVLLLVLVILLGLGVLLLFFLLVDEEREGLVGASLEPGALEHHHLDQVDFIVL